MPATVTAASPTSGPLALTMTRAKTADFAIQVLQADGVTPQDLTGATLLFYAQVAGLPIAKSSAGTGITINSLTGGIATLEIAVADTTGISFGGTNQGPCELSMQIGGKVFELSSGTLTVYSNVGTP